MTTVVLLVLAVVWGLVLFSWLRSRSHDGAFTDSVGTFRRHLGVLERTSPVTVQPANRMRSGYVAGRQTPAYGRGPFPGARPVSPRYGRMALRPPTPASIRRRQNQRRRRQVLLVLAVITGATMVAAAATKNRDAVIALALAIFALCSYIALLVRMQNLAAERDMKLTYLSQARRDAVGRSADPARRPARRRPSTHERPSTYEVDGGGYEVAPGYGQLAMRRVAN